VGNSQSQTRHILGLSGGKDSSALALYMREHHPEIDVEYFFTDTGSELPEVYTYLEKLEAQLLTPIARLHAKDVHNNHQSLEDGGESVFGELFKNAHNGFLPSPQARWCTVMMKLKPLEKWIAPTLAQGGTVYSYIAIRADEDRLGYNPSNPAVHPVFPFVEDGIDLFGVNHILETSGIGLPSYYDWRSRSGCTFCFYQQKIEWVGLYEKHNDKYLEAMEFEKYSMKVSLETGRDSFSWSQGETLEQLMQPERREAIKIDFAKRLARLKKRKSNVLQEGLESDIVDVDDVYGHNLDISVCVTCHK
jgi:hypothetical protein